MLTDGSDRARRSKDEARHALALTREFGICRGPRVTRDKFGLGREIEFPRQNRLLNHVVEVALSIPLHVDFPFLPGSAAIEFCFRS